MNVRNNYNIAFKGLAAGDHRYEFEAGDKFFEAFEGSEIKGGDINVDVVLHKGSGALTLDFTITGDALVECDRCLDYCRLPVNYHGQLAVKFTGRELAPGEEYDGEVLWLKQEEGELNVAQYIYESVILSLPYQRVHPDNAQGEPTCNPDMLGRFSIISQEEFDSMAGEPEMQKMNDNPEWEKLRKLKEDMEG